MTDNIQQRLDNLEKWRRERIEKAHRQHDAELKHIQNDYEAKLQTIAKKLIEVSPKKRKR